jgi:hypothetical protein
LQAHLLNKHFEKLPLSGNFTLSGENQSARKMGCWLRLAGFASPIGWQILFQVLGLEMTPELFGIPDKAAATTRQ